jgi:hypothetical protein
MLPFPAFVLQESVSGLGGDMSSVFVCDWSHNGGFGLLERQND